MGLSQPNAAICMPAPTASHASLQAHAASTSPVAEAEPAAIAAFRDGAFVMIEPPDWWQQEEWFTSTPLTTSLEVGPMGSGVVSRRAPQGVTVCLIGNDERQDVTAIWCPTEADYLAFLCGPGAAFASACASILAADPLKRGSWR